MSLFQNPVGFEQAHGKTGRKPGFSPKFKVAVPKAEGLEQPQWSNAYREGGIGLIAFDHFLNLEFLKGAGLMF
jgi:hypothetical protein